MKRKFTVCLTRMTRLNLLTFILLTTTTGCTGLHHWHRELSGCVSNHMVDYSNRALAERAWIKRKELYCDFQYQQEFKDGFIAGYLDVADGGDGCTPTIAPQKYWGWAYQTPHGQAAVRAFFQGFPFGAKAAEEDGVGFWTAIPTSGLEAIVPHSTPIERDDLPVPAPTIESDPASANEATNSFNQRITSPSDEKSNVPTYKLVDSMNEQAKPAANTGGPSPVPKGQGQNESDLTVFPAATTEQPELSFTFE